MGSTKNPSSSASCKNADFTFQKTGTRMTDQLTAIFYKILNIETGEFFSTKNTKTVWARLSGAKTTITTNKLDPEIFIIYEFVGVGQPVKR